MSFPPIPANDAITFHFIDGANFNQPLSSFQPMQTYPFFGEAQIIPGYETVHIDCFIQKDTFNCVYEQQLGEATPQAQDPLEIILTYLNRCTLSRDRNSFSNPENTDEFHLPWKPIREYMPCPSYNPNGNSSTPLGNSIFQIYRAPLSDPDMKIFHKKLMAMPFFFINYASYLDEDDPNWDVYLMYKKTNKPGDSSNPPRVDFQIVGYATVYRFFHFPNSSLWRISQVLVFPPFHHQGHATYLTDTVYSLSKKNNVTLITVELQSVQFKMMRTLVDMAHLRRNHIFQFRQNEAVAPFSNFIISDIQSKVPIIKEQLQRCYFIFRWRVLDQKNAELVKDFRVDVKRYLYLKHEEELAGLEQSERMTKLDLLYQIQVTEMRMASSCFDKHLDFIEQGVWNPPDE